MLKDKLNIIELIDTYGILLTETKMAILKDYYMLDISLVEIAEVRGISRQAVFDSITKSVEKLRSYEDNLKIISKRKKIRRLLTKCYKEQKLNEKDIKKFLGVLEK